MPNSVSTPISTCLLCMREPCALCAWAAVAKQKRTPAIVAMNVFMFPPWRAAKSFASAHLSFAASDHEDDRHSSSECETGIDDTGRNEAGKEAAVAKRERLCEARNLENSTTRIVNRGMRRR